MNQVPSDLAHFRHLTQWTPQIGDIVIWHGWLTHWYGVVRFVDTVDNQIHVIRKGLPVLLLTLEQGEYENNTIKIPIYKIKKSSGGKYATIRSIGNNTIWYI